MNTHPLMLSADVPLQPLEVDERPTEQEEHPGFVFQIRRPDTMAWATWLTWGRMGDPRSLQRLRADLEEKGIWRAAEDAADWGNAQRIACRWQSWTAYEMALACAAVLLLSPAEQRGGKRRAWAQDGLELAQQLAAQSPEALTPDGAPLRCACALVAASCALAETNHPPSQAAGWQRLNAVLSDPAMRGAPSAWRQMAWRLAERYHRQMGRADMARYYLGLAAADQPSAAAVMARLRLGQPTPKPVASTPPLS